MNAPQINQHFKGLRTVIYNTPELGTAKAWYSAVLGIEPYFDQPFYVGYNVGGYELGLDPNAGDSKSGNANSIAYWGVDDAYAELARLIGLGAKERTGVEDVGDDIRVATVLDPFGNIFGIIQNPHFKLPAE